MKSTLLRIAILIFVSLSVASAKAAYARDDRGETEFTGVVESLPNTPGFIGDWRVSGRTVHVTSSTKIDQEDGQAAVGATVKVEGTSRSDGSVDAKEVDVKGQDHSGGSGSGDDTSAEVEFTGTVESLPSTPGFIGDWKVSGRTVHVTSSTKIDQEDGQVAVGAIVKVDGASRSDGSVDAKEIDVKSQQQGGSGGDDGSQQGSQIEFKGTIESVPGTTGFIGDWHVGGRTIHVTGSTKIDTEDGPVAVGAFVEITGTVRTDGSMDATKIEVKSNVAGGDGRDELKGTIESLPGTPGFIGDWKVSGKTVHVTAATMIDQEHGAVAVGASVEIKGTARADGSLDATKIEVTTSGSADQEGQKAKVKGAIASLPSDSSLVGDWTVGSTTVHVTSSTRLAAEHGMFAVGTSIKVKGLKLADGSVVATKIQVVDSN